MDLLLVVGGKEERSEGEDIPCGAGSINHFLQSFVFFHPAQHPARNPAYDSKWTPFNSVAQDTDSRIKPHQCRRGLNPNTTG